VSLFHLSTPVRFRSGVRLPGYVPAPYSQTAPQGQPHLQVDLSSGRCFPPGWASGLAKRIAAAKVNHMWGQAPACTYQGMAEPAPMNGAYLETMLWGPTEKETITSWSIMNRTR
jgi:hypothetical protein